MEVFVQSKSCISTFKNNLLFFMLISILFNDVAVFHYRIQSPHIRQCPMICWGFLLRKLFFFLFVSPSGLIKHANSNKATAVHTPDSADRLIVTANLKAVPHQKLNWYLQDDHYLSRVASGWKERCFIYKKKSYKTWEIQMK